MDPHAGLPVVASGAPLGQGRGAVVMLHGRGASPQNILELVPVIARPSFSFLAPSAADNTWYPFSFLSPLEQNEPKLSSALRRIESLVAEISAMGVPASRIVLLGFSQGACLAGEFSVRHPTRYGGVVMLSGGLIGPPGTTWQGSPRLAGTPVFLGCSDRDPHIPRERVGESAAVFEALGADVTERIYSGMGHLVSADEIAEVQVLLDRV